MGKKEKQQIWRKKGRDIKWKKNKDILRMKGK